MIALLGVGPGDLGSDDRVRNRKNSIRKTD
jgi:hypothetical protein